MRLNLGCGSQAKDGWVNLDIAAQAGVDVVHDLDVGPWPFEDRTAEQIEAWDVFEHVADPVLFMTECHRILRPFKYLHVHTPHYTSPDAFTDPTHRRFPTEHTFDYWIPGTHLYRRHNAGYGGVAFELLDMHMDSGSLDLTLRKLWKKTDKQLADLLAREAAEQASDRS